MDKEAYFIARFAKSSFIGDDAAILGKMCVSQDAFFENVHFSRRWMDLYRIGRKAMLVNISDAVAMNADPRYALLTVAMPPSLTRKQMAELARGLQETAEEYGVQIVGGDTIADDKLDISVTILADCDKPLQRKGLKEGDLLAYTGRLGTSAKDLKRLMRGGHVSPRSRFLDPQLRVAFVRKAAPSLRVGMDISDGLFTDLRRLHETNRLGFRFLRPIPRSVGCSGEEFEMLVAFDPRHKEKILQIARQTRTPLTIFAEAVRAPYKDPCRPHHFR